MSGVVLVSNKSAGGADGDDLARVEEVLSAVASVRLVEPADGDESALVSAASTASYVVVAGGDGTMNRTINALGERLDRVAIGLIPMGTGNDLARTLGIPRAPVEAARRFVEGAERKLDLARASGDGVTRLFVNACMGGFPVDVNEAIDEDTKRRLGPVAFWVGGVKAATDLTRHRVRMNDVTVDDCVAVGVGNGRTCGGGMTVWPDASPDDGLVDGCALGAPDNATALQLALRVRSGNHVGMRSVSSTRAARVVIDADPPVEFNVDGELLGLTTPASFEVAGELRFRL